jgi:uncharacterized Fe-S cluster-containing MiaB family protein
MIILNNTTKYKRIGNFILNYAKQIYRDNEDLVINIFSGGGFFNSTGILKDEYNNYIMDISLIQLINIKKGKLKMNDKSRQKVFNKYSKDFKTFLKFVLLHELGHKFYKHCLVSPLEFSHYEIIVKDLYCDIFAELLLTKLI